MRSKVELLQRNRSLTLRWMIVLSMAIALGLPSTGWADDGRTQHEVPGGEEPIDDDRPTLGGGEGPGGDIDARGFVEQREFEGLQRQDEQIVRLQQMIENTPEGDSDRAEYLYNLSEIYWQRSRYYDSSAIEQQDQCYLLEDEGKEQEARRCRFRMEDMEAESERLREESIDLYVEIIRNYPDFDELDTIYFQLGSNMMDVGEEDDGLAIFRRLLSEFPNTEYLPRVLLYFGDHYFDEGDMFEALEAYQKVVEYPDSVVYQYARYKMGWTYFNIDNYERSLEQFLEVVDLAQAADEGTAERAMLNQTRNDIVRVYARIGSPDRAIAFFQDIAPEREDWLALAERLAVFYGDEAAFADSTRMYRHLINVNENSVKVLDYQYEIVRNTTTIDSYSQDSIQELGRMMRLVQLADEGQFEEDLDEYDSLHEKVERSSRNWANTYHREAQRTRNQQLFVMAHHLYDRYRTTFPESEHQYDMNFFHGELLYEIEQWDEAAKAYERVIEIDPEGEYTEDAVHATMLALLEEVETSEERADIDADFEEDEEEDAAEIPEPQEMSELEERLIRAAKNYIKYAPDGERIVEVKYTKARTYFDYDHLEEAYVIFEDIAFNHSDHDLADVSANLHLATLNTLQMDEELVEAAARYLEEQPIDDAEFQEDLYALNKAIRYNLCVSYDEEERWEEAAHCYIEYVGDYPNAEQADKALYNAALDFERIHEVGLAIQVRRQLLERYGDSDLAPQTLYNIGGNYHAWAIYGDASRFYELYVQNFPDEEHAEAALSNAATFRHGLGQFDRAIANYERYLEMFGDENPQEAAQVFFEIGQIYEEQGREADAYEHYQDYIDQYGQQGTNDQLLQAYLKRGLYYWENGRRQDALDAFETTLSVYDSLSEEAIQEMSDGRDAAAQAKFMIAEDLLEDAEAIRIESSDSDELQEATEKKMEAAEKAQKVYEEVITKFSRPDWAIAAAYRIGSGYQDFAEALRESPVPDGLTIGQEEQYKGLLEDYAMQYEAVAVEMYEGALDAARDANWFNQYSEQAEVELAQLRPRDYRRPSELRAQPTYLDDGFMRSSFATDVEADDTLEEMTDEDDEDLVQGDDVAPGDEQASDSDNDGSQPAS